MIKVTIKEQSKQIKEFIISGHANAAKKPGEFDLVCAGVSAVAYGILNSLNPALIDVKIKDGFISIVVNEYSDENEFILEILETSLRTIEEQYGNHISVEEEVL